MARDRRRAPPSHITHSDRPTLQAGRRSALRLVRRQGREEPAGRDTGVISGALLFIGKDFHGLTSFEFVGGVMLAAGPRRAGQLNQLAVTVGILVFYVVDSGVKRGPRDRRCDPRRDRQKLLMLVKRAPAEPSMLG
jgi:hypothetical protein